MRGASSCTASAATPRTPWDERDSRTALVTQVDALRDEVSGVSLDEEAMHLLKFQRAYEANARFFRVIDESIQTLLRTSSARRSHNMRITFNSQYRDAQAGIEAASDQLIEMQRQVATGRRINKPSDDPSGAATRRHRTRPARQRRAVFAERRLRHLAPDGRRFGAVGHHHEADRRAEQRPQRARLEQEPGPARGDRHDRSKVSAPSLLDDVNTTFHGTYVFSGAKSTTKPYTESGGVVSAYAGSTTEVDVDIAEERSITTGFNGEAIVKGSAATDMFGELNNLITAVRAGDSSGMQTALTNLDAAFTRATTAQTRVGVALSSIEAEQAPDRRTRSWPCTHGSSKYRRREHGRGHLGNDPG